MQKTPDQPRTITLAIYERLRSDILNGVLKPGEKLRMETLRDIYGASASPLREGLARLVAEGFVVQFDQRGFRVADLSLDNLEELMRTRSLIHEVALRESIAHGDSAWEERIVLTYHWLSRSPGRDQRKGFDPRWLTSEAGLFWQERHRAFHSALLSGARSKLLLDFADTLFDYAARYNPAAMTASQFDMRDIDAEHEAIMQAVLSRDLARSIKLLDEHIALTRDYLREAIEANRRKPEAAESADSDSSSSK
jgi:GntR family carbon starvation induced transcriptional regulator